MIILTRFTKNKVQFFCNNKKEKRYIDNVLKFWNEGAIYSKLFKERKWDGYTRFYDKNNVFSIGFLEKLIKYLEKNNIQFKLRDKFKDKIKLENFNYSIKFDRKYQIQAVKTFFDENFGIIVVPTRGGKTYIASQCIYNFILNFDGNVLFVVDGIDLFKQTKTSFTEILKEEIGNISEGNIKINRVTIAMAQSLVSILYRKGANRKRKNELIKYLNTVKFLIVDEIHDNLSDKRLNSFKKCKNTVLDLFLSATPFKMDNEKMSMVTKDFYGNVIYKISKKSLQEKGYLSLDKAILVYNEQRNIRIGKNFHDYLRLNIHENDSRNEIIEKFYSICKKNNFKSLFLFNSKRFGYYLSERFNNTFLSGDDNSNVRDMEKKNFLSKDGGILFASNIFKKGITLPDVEVILLCDGGSERTNIKQKYGRALGTTKSKKYCIILDILDMDQSYFSKHSLNRLKLYNKDIGEDKMEIYDNNVENWDLIENSMINWLNGNKIK